MSILLEKLDEIHNQNILEKAINIYFYWEYKHCGKFFYQKWLYNQNRNKFIRKFKKKYPSTTADETSNFIKIYLRYHPSEDHDYFFQEKQLWITNFGFVGPYLKEEGDPEYFWMIECNGLGLHFP